MMSENLTKTEPSDYSELSDLGLDRKALLQQQDEQAELKKAKIDYLCQQAVDSISYSAIKIEMEEAFANPDNIVTIEEPKALRPNNTETYIITPIQFFHPNSFDNYDPDDPSTADNFFADVHVGEISKTELRNSIHFQRFKTALEKDVNVTEVKLFDSMTDDHEILKILSQKVTDLNWLGRELFIKTNIKPSRKKLISFARPVKLPPLLGVIKNKLNQPNPLSKDYLLHWKLKQGILAQFQEFAGSVIESANAMNIHPSAIQQFKIVQTGMERLLTTPTNDISIDPLAVVRTRTRDLANVFEEYAKIVNYL